MSAECNDCGYDLPFMADCSYCTVVRQRDALLEALQAIKRLSKTVKNASLWTPLERQVFEIALAALRAPGQT